MNRIFINTLHGLYQDTVEYFQTIANVFTALATKCYQEVINSELLNLLIEKCIRFADNDP